MIDHARLMETLRSVAPSTFGIGPVGPGPIAAGNVRVDLADESQRAAVNAALASYDWSDAAQSVWELDRTRAAALTGLLTRGDDIGIGSRAVNRAITTLVNDRLEAIYTHLGMTGTPRVLEAEILAFIRANPTIGDPVIP